MIPRFIAFCLLACLLLSCGKETRPGAVPAPRVAQDGASKLAEEGRKIFSNTRFGEVDIACIDCHADYADEAEAGERIRPGHSIVGAARRLDTWNGEFSGAALKATAAGAAKCAAIYQQRAETVAAALSPREAAALLAFFESISTGKEAPRLKWSAVAYPGDPHPDTAAFRKETAAITARHGDPANGELLFGKTCAICHGPDGRRIGPPIRILKKHADEAAEHVRGGYDAMPFFSRDKLSDAQIADIISYIRR